MNRNIYRRDDGQWVNRLQGANRASSIHETQGEAINTARNMLIKSGGGELSVHGRDGKIRSKDTIGDGNDPCPPRDKEH